MGSSTVVLVTGVGRGIGHAVAAEYLLRPNHTVIGSIRDAESSKVQVLNKLPTAARSRLILVSIENTSTTDAKKAVGDIEAAGVDHIDVVISNAGVSPDPAPLDAIDTNILIDSFKVNTVSTVLLFQAVHKLLTKATSPKWVSVSSRAGSIGQAADFYWYISPYGMSKAAQNWFTSEVNRTIHTAIGSLTAFAVHPGFVQTDMGEAAAKSGGIERPPTTAQESSTKLIQLIDTATRETTSGKFIDVISGEEYLF